MTTDQRIECLESRCRFLMACLTGLCLVVAGAIFCGAAQNNADKAMRVESLEIVDGNGKTRMRLGELNDIPKSHSVFGLVAHDANGNVRISLNDLAQLNLTTGGGSASIGASDRSAVIQLAAAGMQPRLLASATDDHCALMLRDANGELAWEQATPRIKIPRELRNADPFKP